MIKRKSMFLIVALWIFSLLSIFCMGIGIKTYLQIQKTKLNLSKQRAFYLAVCGVETAKTVFESDDREIDNLLEDWAKVKAYSFSFDTPKAEAKLTVSISDEQAKININLDNEAVLKRAFEYFEIDDYEKKVDYILDYIDEDSSSRNLGSETNAKNADFSVLEEIALFSDFSRDDYEKIVGNFTIYLFDNKLNINTASKEVLYSVIEDDAILDDVLDLRCGDNGILGDEDDRFYGSENILPQNLNSLFAVKSNIFRIVSKAVVKNVTKKITCVLDINEGKILYWHEE